MTMDLDVQPMTWRKKLANGLLRKPGLGLLRLAARVGGASPAEEALRKQLDHADQQDLIDEGQKEMISNIIDLDDVNADDLMTHRMDMIAVEENTPCRQVLEVALESGYSRLPIYRKTVDDIVGMLYVKDLLTLFTHPEIADEPVTALAHPAMFVPESRGARELLLDFKQGRTMVAVVVDEYGGTAGLVSMEDILEEIVGDIQDEYDDEEDPLVACDGGFIAEGSLDLEDVFDAFDLPVPESEDEDEHDSIGGLVVDLLGHFPQPSEEAQVSFGGLVLRPVACGERRVEKVFCSRASAQAEENEH